VGALKIRQTIGTDKEEAGRGGDIGKLEGQVGGGPEVGAASGGKNSLSL